MSDSAVKARTKPFYGYWLAGYSFVALFAAASFFLHARGIFLPQWMADFDVSRAEISFAISMTLFTGSCLAPFTGYLLDRFPVRRLIAFGWCWLAIGYLVVINAPSFGYFLATLILFQGAGWTFIGPLAQTKLMVSWFSRHRGMALGIAIMGISVAGIAMPIVNTWLAETVGWRGAYQVYAGAIVLVLLPLTWLVVRNRPEDYGLWPDGATDPPVAQPAAESVPKGEGRFALVYATYREFLASRAFWSVVITFGLMNGVYSAMITHLPSYLTSEHGYSLGEAALALTCAGGAAIGGKILMGWMMDNWPAKVTVMLSVASYFVSTLVFLHAGAFALIVVAACLFGLAFGGMVPVRSVLLSRLFGTAKFSRVNGLLSFFLAPATFWVAITGWLADYSGTYQSAFMVWAVAFVLAGIISAIVKLPDPQDAVA
ncbi:MAG: MFS transporter [Pseudomonadota bacterium]